MKRKKKLKTQNVFSANQFIVLFGRKNCMQNYLHRRTIQQRMVAKWRQVTMSLQAMQPSSMMHYCKPILQSGTLNSQIMANGGGFSSLCESDSFLFPISDMLSISNFIMTSTEECEWRHWQTKSHGRIAHCQDRCHLNSQCNSLIIIHRPPVLLLVKHQVHHIIQYKVLPMLLDNSSIVLNVSLPDLYVTHCLQMPF